MKLFFAGAETYADVLASEGVQHVLMAYPALAKNPDKFLRHYEGKEVFLDCGAWSVFSRSAPAISLREYIDWLRVHGARFSMVAALDVIGDPVATRQNYDVMHAEGVPCLPTWHVGEGPEYARHYCSRTEHLCLGGIAGLASTGQTHNLVAKMTPELAGKRVHFFGVKVPKVLLDFQPDSADQTGWLIGASKGEVYSLMDWPRLVHVGIRANTQHFSRREVMKRSGEFRHFGTSWEEMSKDGPVSKEARLRYNIRVLLEMTRRITEVGERRQDRTP